MYVIDGLVTKKHPWLGAPLSNGLFTEKFSNKPIAIPLQVLTGAKAIVTIGGKALGPVQNVTWSGGPIEWIGATANIEDVKQSECICTSRTVFNTGCVCGHVKRKNWGL